MKADKLKAGKPKADKLRADKLELLEELWLNICVICSMIGLTALILDWYNPYMNFSAYIWFAQVILYISVIAGAFFRKIFCFKNIKENIKETL